MVATASVRTPGRMVVLDVLRVLAGILLVPMFHLHKYLVLPKWFHFLFQEGHRGVDIFFVLSPVLVVGPLIRLVQRCEGKVDYVDFLIKRWTRTVPVFLVILAVHLYILEDVPLEKAWVFMFFLINLFAPIDKLLSVLGVTIDFSFPPETYFTEAWTLAAEEVFYVLSVILVPIVWRVSSSRRAIIRLLVPVFLGCLIFYPFFARMFLHYAFGYEGFAYTHRIDTRGDGLIWGTLFVATMVLEGKEWEAVRAWYRRVRYVSLAVGVALLGYMLVTPGIHEIVDNAVTSVAVVLILVFGYAWEPVWRSEKAREMFVRVAAWLERMSSLVFGYYITHLIVRSLTIPTMGGHAGERVLFWRNDGLSVVFVNVICSYVLAKFVHQYIEMPMVARREEYRKAFRRWEERAQAHFFRLKPALQSMTVLF